MRMPIARSLAAFSDRWMIALGALVLTGLPIGSASAGPVDLPGLTLWYQADAITPQADGSLLTTWVDSSSSGNHAVAPVGKEPTYRTGGGGPFGGMPYVYFSGTGTTGKYVQSTSALTGNLTGDLTTTVFTVTGDGASSSGMYNIGNVFAVGGAMGPARDFRGAGVYSVEFAGNTPAIFGPVASGTQITEVRKSPGAINTTTSFWVNGTAQAIGGGSSTNTPNTISAPFILGKFGPSGSGIASWGNVAETIVYNRALSQAEADQVGAYLAVKYAITNSQYPVRGNASAAPLNTPGLVLWLDADPSFVTRDASNRVSAWFDATGTTNNTVAQDVSQGTSTAQPLWVANGINGQPAVQFDGGDFLVNTVDSLLASGQARTVFVIGDGTDGDAGGGLFAFRRSARVNSLGETYYAAHNPPQIVYSDGASGDNNTWGPDRRSTVNQPFIAAFMTTAGEKPQVDLNGPSQVIATGAASGSVSAETGTTGFSVGGRSDITPDRWKGTIAEVLVYDHELTGAELNSVGYYLAQRYSLTQAPYAKPSAVLFGDNFNKGVHAYYYGINPLTPAEATARQFGSLAPANYAVYSLAGHLVQTPPNGFPDSMMIAGASSAPWSSVSPDVDFNQKPGTYTIQVSMDPTRLGGQYNGEWNLGAVIFGADTPLTLPNIPETLSFYIQGNGGWGVRDGTTLVGSGMLGATGDDQFYNVRIEYEVKSFNDSTPVDVSIYVDNTNIISFLAGGIDHNFISLTAYQNPGYTGNFATYFDNFIISYTIPEPSTLVLLALGGLGLLACRRRKK